MIVDTLKVAAEAVANAVNRNSLNPLHRCFELGPNSIRACSELGNIEHGIDIPELSEKVLINSDAFLAVINSLRPGVEVSLIPLGDRILWESGTAKGYLSIVQMDDEIPTINYIDTPWTPPATFSGALDLVASACDAVTVSVGLYGVVLEPDGSNLRVASSNGFSLAVAWVPLVGYPTQDRITLRPPVPTIISNLLHAGTNTQMNITPLGVYMLADNLLAHLPLSYPLNFDLGVILTPYADAKQVVKIDSTAVKRFIDRSKKLVDKGSKFLITVKIVEGHIVLEQASASAGSEQYFIAEGLDRNSGKEYASVALSGKLMATSLTHIQEVVLDYLEENTIIFQGEEPTFKHIIGGVTK